MTRARRLGLAALAAFAALAAAPAATAPEAKSVLPFLPDDYGKALTLAREKKLPLFVEAWAPWCHTCRSMQAFVFTDKSLARRAGEFVWLSIDTEKKGNAPFLTKYPVEVWPTLFVVDPAKEEALVRWVGGATVPQLEKILDDGRRAMRGNETGVDATLARADRLYAEKKNAEAAAAYREALAAAPPQWPSRARATESLLFTLHKSGDEAGCATMARDVFPKLADTPSAANVAASGLDCALRLDRGDASRAELVAALAADGRSVVARPRPDLAADDVSSLYGSLANEREDAGDGAGERQILTTWAAFLEAQASAAKTPAARAVFDSHRLSVYLALDEPKRAIPMLKASEKDFPDDYNPPARLTLAYEAMKDYETALASSDKALSKAYGPRLVGMLVIRARIYQEKGDLVSARIAMQEAIREAEALPPGQRSDSQIAALRKKLEEVPQ